MRALGVRVDLSPECILMQLRSKAEQVSSSVSARAQQVESRVFILKHEDTSNSFMKSPNIMNKMVSSYR